MSYPDNEYNILLFGETGAGKSTFINALDSYIKYPTLDKALESDVCCCIPIKFTWQNSDDFEDTVVEFGSDKNENLNVDGQSSTENLAIYNFKYQNKIFRFIDTPGFNDTRGYEMDSKNIRKIVKFLEERFQSLHAVCVLLKPDENRQTLKFKYNIKNIFSTFHKDIFNNFIFLFTHSKGVNFKPNTTNRILQDIVHEITAEHQDISIPNNNANWFFVDNVCFKYLLAVKLNADSTNSKDVYSKDWSKSASACFRLLNYIHTIPPYAVKVMLSVVRAKFKIEELFCKDIVEMKNKIKEHQTQKHKMRKMTDYCEKNIERLKSREYDTNITLREGPYHMICVNDNCRTGGVYGRNGKACCPNCTALIKSWCYAFSNSHCTLCGCSVDTHEFLYKPNFEEKERRKNIEIERLIQQEREKIETYQANEQKQATSISKLQKDMTDIEDSLVFHIDFLKNYGVLVYNDETIQQMEMEISTSNTSRGLKYYLEAYKDLYRLYNA